MPSPLDLEESIEYPDCIFCRIIADEIPSHKLHQDENFVAFLDIQPLNNGHTLVVPRKHYRWVYDVEKFGEYWLRIPSSQLKERKPEQYAPIVTLWKNRNNADAAAELQWRISMPLSVIILTLLAVPLSKVKTRQGKFAQLIPAILIYIVYADLIFVARVWIQKGSISSLLGIWWVHGVFFLLAMALLGIFFGWWKKLS